MGNLTKKTITRGAVVALALSAGAATTANAAVTRTSGADRYATATEIFKAWPTTTDTAVLAAGMGHDVDALTVAPLAKAKNAPVILVDTKATTAAIVAQFSAFKTVYIANGTGVISKDVETALVAAGKTVTRLGGATRTETALNIAKAIGTANGIVVANGDDSHLVDTLSIASIAAAKGMPIFLTSGGSLSADEATYAKGLGATNVYALGGTSVVSDAAVAGLGKATRLAGAGRYETNAAVVTAFKADLDLSNIYVASGEDANLIDALAGAPLAGLKKAPIVFAHNSLNADVNTLLTGSVTKDTNVVVLGGTGAVSADAAGAIMNIQVPGSYVPSTPSNGTLSVSSVTATGAKTIKVTFSQAPADTSKVVFTALRGTIAAPTTTTWNAAKTEAVLTSAANFPTGDYTVNVKNDTTDLGTSKVSFTDQKIAKIAITGTKVGVFTDKNNVQTGYATYTVTDQYGGDITHSSLGNGVTFQTGVGTINAKDGVIKITPTGNLNLLTFTSGITISANDTSTGVSASATLSVTSQVGTLSDISISAVTNADGKTLTAGDDSTVFYATYTALDVSGNATTDYDLVKNGLIYTDETNLTISTSSPYVVAKVVKDPSDSKKAAIEIKATTDTITLDTPVTINAMTWTGKNASFSVTLKKQSTVTTFTLMTPSYDIADNESKDIPFTAMDQDGNIITKYNDIAVGDNKVNFSSNLDVKPNADGTLSLKNKKVPNGTTNTVPAVFTATTSTGKYSSITINIQKTVKPDSLFIDAGVSTNLEQGVLTTTSGGIFYLNGSVQKLDLGEDKGNITIHDQYDRVMDTTTVSKYSGYRVVATSSNPSAINIVSNYTTTGDPSTQIQIQPLASGSATVTFDFYDTSDVDATRNTLNHWKLVDTQTKNYTSVKDSDIKDYGIDAVANPIYAGYDNKGTYTVGTPSVSGLVGFNTNPSTGKLTDEDSRIADFKANPNVYGKTSGGSHVVLRDKSVIGSSVDSSDFTVYHGFKGDNPGDIKVVANKLDPSKSGSSTNLNVSVMGGDGLVHAVTTAIKSTNADPMAKGLSVAYKTKIAGVTQDDDIITITSSTSTIAAIGLQVGNYMQKYDEYGIGDNGHGDYSHISSIHFEGTDQYGTAGLLLTSFTVKDDSNTGFTVDPTTGKITNLGTIANGINADVIITATVGGYVKTVTLRFTTGAN